MAPKDVKLIRDEPEACCECGAMEVWHVYSGVCEPCGMVLYLKFRYAMGWPLTEQDKIRLGLVPNNGGKS